MGSAPVNYRQRTGGRWYGGVVDSLDKRIWSASMVGIALRDTQRLLHSKTDIYDIQFGIKVALLDFFLFVGPPVLHNPQDLAAPGTTHTNPHVAVTDRQRYERPSQFATLPRRAGLGLYASSRRAARGQQAQPLDVVHLPADRRARPQRDGTLFRDRLVRRGGGVSRAPDPRPPATRVLPSGDADRGALGARDLRHARRHEIPLVADAVRRRRGGQRGLCDGAAEVFRRRTRWLDPGAAVIVRAATPLHDRTPPSV